MRLTISISLEDVEYFNNFGDKGLFFISQLTEWEPPVIVGSNRYMLHLKLSEIQNAYLEREKRRLGTTKIAIIHKSLELVRDAIRRGGDSTAFYFFKLGAI